MMAFFIYSPYPKASYYQISNVVDDFSTDGTPGILQEQIEGRKGIRVLYHDLNRGKGVTLRKGTARATGDIVFLKYRLPKAGYR